MSDQFAARVRRRPNDGGFRAGRYAVTTTDILCVLSSASMFVWGISRSLWQNLPFIPFAVRDFEVWRLVTWPIAAEPAIWPLLGIVFFFLFGQQVEALFGREKFFAWIAAVTLVPAISMTLLGTLGAELDVFAEFGLSNLFLGGIWVYAATYPGVKWFEVVPLWALAAVFTVLSLLQFSGTGNTGRIFFLLISVGTALVAGRSLGLATGWPIPHLPLDGAGRRKPKKTKKSKPARGSGPRVVEGPWKSGPAPMPPPGVPTAADQAELDALLDKIGADGMESLGPAEKQRLNDLSKRLRNN